MQHIRTWLALLQRSLSSSVLGSSLAGNGSPLVAAAHSQIRGTPIAVPGASDSPPASAMQDRRSGESGICHVFAVRALSTCEYDSRGLRAVCLSLRSSASC